MESLLKDLRYGLRTLWNSKAVSIIAIVTLALGIGANTAIFSIVYAVLLKPLPFQQPDRLVAFRETEASPGEFPMSGADFQEWKKYSHSFEAMSLYSWTRFAYLNANEESQPVAIVPTEADFFNTLGVSPLLGRTFVKGEDQPGAQKVAILTWPVWSATFNSDRNVVGRTIRLDGESYTVVGVMKSDMRFPTGAQVYVTQEMSEKALGPHGSHGPGAVGRLKPGVTIEQARADLDAIAQRLAHDFPISNKDVRPIVLPLNTYLSRQYSTGLWMMVGAVVLVLLIACVNVANLLLARALTRHREMAIRSALGADRPRIVRQLLTESVLLAILGAAAGIFCAELLVRILTSMKQLALPSDITISIDGTALLFTLVIAVASGILFGLAPAWSIARSTGMFDELRGGSGRNMTASRAKRRITRILVTSEIALSVLLLICAALVLKDFAALRTSEIGVRTDHVFTAAVRLPGSTYEKQAQQFQFSNALLEKIRQLPGVERASISDRLPLNGGTNGYIHLPGHENEGQGGPLVESHNVSAEYFEALNISLVQGRSFDREDLANEIHVDETLNGLYTANQKPTAEQGKALMYRSVINKTMASSFWPGEDPIGKIYTTGDATGPWHQVVGVVGDVRQWGLAQPPQPETFDVFDGQPQFFLVIHTSVDPASITSGVRQALASLDSGLALSRVRTMQDLIGESSAGAQMLGTLLGLFAGLALLLAGIGVYGVLGNTVLQRTQEIGIRMSLGASRARVVWMMLWDGFQLAIPALIVGIAAAFAARKVIATSLATIKPDDPFVYTVAPIFMLIVAGVACYLPARRASRVDPMNALRQE